MSKLTNVFANLLSKSPVGGSVELPQAEDEPLTKSPSETCELRIEGMTCSACVEVCATGSTVGLPGLAHTRYSRSRACSVIWQAFIPFGSLC